MAVKLYTPDSNVIVHETKVDFRRRIVQRQVNLVQYDKSMPIIAVQLYSNGNEYVLPENANAYIRFGKRDHTYVYNECLGCDQTRTIVYFAITDQMTIFYGEHTPIVELRIGDTVAGSGSIPIWIDRNPIQNGDTESKSDLSVFEKAIEAAKKITDLGIGKSVFPVLNLMNEDMSAVRSTITEEEKTNLEKGLYHSVHYLDLSLGETAPFSVYAPQMLVFLNDIGGSITFTSYNFQLNGEIPFIVSASTYSINIGGKNDDGNYPITIEKAVNADFGSGRVGGNSLTLKLTDLSTGEQKTSITEEEKANLENGKYGFISYYDPSWDETVAEYMVIFPQLLGSFQGNYFALIYNISTVVNDVPSISGLLGYSIEIGEKNSNGTYPLTIEKAVEMPFAGGSSGTIETITATKTSDQELEEMGLTALKLAKAPTGSQFILSYNDNYILMTNIGGSYKGASFDSVFGSSIRYAYAGVDNTGNVICAYKYFDVTFLDLAEDETNAGMILTVKEHGGLGLANPHDTGSSITIRRW